MYYYIIEAPPKFNLGRFQKKIKQILTDLNINGEMALASPARSAENLAQMGLEKGYNTIVAIGGDSLVNRLASLLVNTPAALGAVPINLSPDLAAIFTGYDLKNACYALRQRFVRHIDLGHIAPQKYFLSDAIIEPERPFDCTIDVDHSYRLQATIAALKIRSNLEIRFITGIPQQSRSWWQRIRITPFMHNETVIKAEDFHLYTASPLPVMVAENLLAKTPMHVTRASKVLKIITYRDKIKTS